MLSSLASCSPAFVWQIKSTLKNELVISTKIKIIPDEYTGCSGISEAHWDEAACPKLLQLGEKARKQNVFWLLASPTFWTPPWESDGNSGFSHNCIIRVEAIRSLPHADAMPRTSVWQSPVDSIASNMLFRKGLCQSCRKSVLVLTSL